MNARIGYAAMSRFRPDLDVFNIFNAKANDVDYFYTSRLPAEPAAGVGDVHFHPLEKRVVRLGVRTTF